MGSTIDFPDVGQAEKLTVSVNLSNSDLSGVTIKLFDPTGAAYLLYDKNGPGTEFATTFPEPTATLSGDLTTWIGKNPQGTWTLQVIDDAFLNNLTDGQINSWNISIQTLSSKKVQLKGDLIIDGSISGSGGLSVDGPLNMGGNAMESAKFQVASEPPAPCTLANTGMVYLDLEELVLKVCIEGEYQTIASGVCGDGKTQGAEECDDGQALNGDGCNAACQTEAGWTCSGTPSVCAAPNCAAILTGNPASQDGPYLLDPNGGSPVDAFETFCNMTSNKNAPDYKRVTPKDFYHADRYQKYGPTNGTSVFDYGCDACASAQVKYEYPCPDEHWEIHTYAIRSHCNHANHTSDTVFKSETFTSGSVPGIRFQQYSDDCGDPNEMTIIGVCRIKGVTAPAPPQSAWDADFRNVNWTN